MSSFDFVRYAGLLGLISLPLTLYFAWMKLGYRVGASITWGSDKFTAAGIRSITLSNLKDRSIVIFEIHFEHDGISFPFKAFDPPLVLKSLEATTILSEDVSEYSVDGAQFDSMRLVASSARTHVFIDTLNGPIRCVVKNRPSRLMFASGRKLRLATTATWRFNNRVYGRTSKYAIVYSVAGKSETALVHESGYIDWRMSPNMLPGSVMNSAESVHAALAGSELGEVLKAFAVSPLWDAK